MATIVRKTDPDLVTMAELYNGLKAQIGAGSHYHLDAAEFTITAADAGGGTNGAKLSSSIALLNEIRAIWELHKADTLAHKVADTATMTAPAATDLTTAEALANELKSDFNVHDGSTTLHYNADSNDISTSDASSYDSLVTLANAIKARVALHMADAPSAASIRLVDA